MGGIFGWMVRTEVCERVRDKWLDPRVAELVIAQMMAWRIEVAERSPIVGLRYGDQGLEFIGSAPWWLEMDKYVTSGGFEGSVGHQRALMELREAKVLGGQGALIVLLLEPDSYIRKRKRREPLATLEERAEIWATSGLCDAVVCLPDLPAGINQTGHYELVHERLKPARWCTNVNHPYLREVILRGGKQAVDLFQIFQTPASIHVSVLASTQGMRWEEAVESLRQRVMDIAKSGEFGYYPHDLLVGQWMREWLGLE